MENTAVRNEGYEEEIRKLRNQFVLYMLGVFLIFSSYMAMINLQSSINIDNGLGTITMSTTFTASALFCIFFTPVIIRRFGAKRCLIASEAMYIFFSLANIYPAFYTLIPAAILAGMGDATIWTCMSMMNINFGMKYSAIRKHETKSDTFYTTLFSGYFFTLFQCCQIFGNLISYVALYAFNDSSTNSDEVGSGNTTDISISTSDYVVNEYYYCGANDCQDPNIVGNDIDQYVPTNKLTLIILISIFTAMGITTITVHVLFLPNIEVPSMVETTQKEHSMEEYCNNAFTLESHEDLEINKESKNECNKIEQQTTSKFPKTKFWPLMKKSVKDFGKHFIQTKQLLIFPICLYDGLMMGFVFSELTRAFSSCVLGVAMVGINMAIYGFADSILSFITGKYGHTLGRPFFLLLASLIDIGNYLYCLLWNPNHESSWSIYLIFFTFGFTDGIWQTLMNVMHIDFFPNEQEIALTSWNFIITLGISIQYAWSTSMCVYIKLYIQFGMLAFGMLCYGIAEFKFGKEKKRKIEDPAPVQITSL